MHPLRPLQSPVHASPANTASALALQKANRCDGTTLGDSPILDSLGIPCDSKRAETALADETAFWRDENSTNPDVEIFRALRPGLSSIPTAMLLNASSP